MKIRIMVVATAIGLTLACKTIPKETVQEPKKATIAFDPTCAGPTYPCALHQTAAQLNVIPWPDPTPLAGLVGAGQCMPMAGYNTTVCRCTDVNTDPTNTKMYSWEVTDTGGDNFQSANETETLIRPVAMATGSNRILNFNSATGACSTVMANSSAPAGGLWSPTLPNVDYYKQGDTSVIERVIGPSGIITATLFDFARCPLLNTIGTITYTTQISSNDSNTFFMALGVNGQGQDKAQYIVGFRVDNRVCTLYNTLTGQVQMAGGIPNVQTVGTVTNFFPFTIHSADLAPGGQLIIGIGSTCTGCPTQHGPFIWYPATTHLDFITSLGGGHITEGNSTYINVTSAPKLASRLFTALNTVTHINTANFIYPQPQDIHMSWGNVDANDTNPICMSQMSINLPQPVVPKVPIQNEVFCVVPKDGSYIRLAPTYSSGIGMPGQTNFRTQYSILTNGKQGYIFFSSDLGGRLGNTDGKTTSCILGAIKPNACRSDVFVVMPKGL